MANDVNTNQYSATMSDWGGEKSSFRLTTGSFATNTEFNSKRTALQSAVAALTLGDFERATASVDFGGLPANTISQSAQRENKFLITYEDDTTGKIYRTSLPTADITAVTIEQGSEVIKLDDEGAVEALVTAFEDFVRSPVGNTVTVTGMRYVGRNL